MKDGAEATSAILAKANEAIDNETRIVAMNDLKSRVDDWKGHNMERFGGLLVYGTHTVLKGEAPGKEVEREVRTKFAYFSARQSADYLTTSVSCPLAPLLKVCLPIYAMSFLYG